MRPIVPLLFSALLAACATPAPRTSADAPLPAGVAEAAQRLLPYWEQHPLLVIGEIHGTQETPALVAALLHTAKRDEPLLLGLEIPRQEQAAIEAFLRWDDSATARRALMQGAFWQREGQDGRSSAAMFELLDAVRRLRAHGTNITVICFDDGAPPIDGLDRDARMAQNLRRALVAHGRPRALVLAGNLHARLRQRQGGARNAQAFMAWHLRDLAPWSIAVGAPTGSYWACAADCGVHPFGAGQAAGAVALDVAEAPDANGYHGRLYLPRFSASAPARDRE